MVRCSYIVGELWSARSRKSSSFPRKGKWFLCFSKLPDQLWRPTSYIFNWVTPYLFQGYRGRSVTDYLPPSVIKRKQTNLKLYLQHFIFLRGGLVNSVEGQLYRSKEWQPSDNSLGILQGFLFGHGIIAVTSWAVCCGKVVVKLWSKLWKILKMFTIMIHTYCTGND